MTTSVGAGLRVVAVVQARMGSTRLPGKVLADLAGRSALARVVERLGRARRVERVVVATTTRDEDDAVAAACAGLGVACVRGSAHDVLDRYRAAAAAHDAAHLARITADCPLLDPAVVDAVVDAYAASGADYASNLEPPTFPHGCDVEVLSRAALERAWREAASPDHREHVTLYVRDHPARFRCVNVAAPVDRAALRWTVDEPRDLNFARAVYERLGDAPFGMEAVLALLAAEPALATLNAGIPRVRARAAAAAPGGAPVGART